MKRLIGDTGQGQYDKRMLLRALMSTSLFFFYTLVTTPAAQADPVDQPGNESQIFRQGETSPEAAQARVQKEAATAPGDLTQDTLSFLGQSAPLEKPVGSENKITIHFMTGVEDRIQQATTHPQMPRHSGAESSPMVLTYERCTHGISAGDSECEWDYSNGFVSTQKRRVEASGDVTKIHTVLTEKDPEDDLNASREILQTLVSKDGHKDSEIYDIVYHFNRGADAAPAPALPEMREVLRYFYETDKDGIEKVHAMSWTKYKPSKDTGEQKIDYHAVLIYDESGRPQQGFADKWSDGRKSENLFYWRPELGALAANSRDQWSMWESWIRTGFLHVYLV